MHSGQKGPEGAVKGTQVDFVLLQLAARHLLLLLPACIAAAAAGPKRSRECRGRGQQRQARDAHAGRKQPKAPVAT